jgi:RNA polymerase sigma-70 factor (ECF subfamily)
MVGAQGSVAFSLTAEREASWPGPLPPPEARAPALAVGALPGAASPPDAPAPAGNPRALPLPRFEFEEVYEEHFDFVWRSVRRLGVAPSAVDDAAQDVFVIVHGRLAEFEGRSSLKTWLFGIVVHVARAHRRANLRSAGERAADPDSLPAPAPGPHEQATAAEAARLLYAVLDELSDERREVFVLMELEEVTAPDVALALGLKLNTVYSRLRHARHDFEAAVARRTAHDEWRLR